MPWFGEEIEVRADFQIKLKKLWPMAYPGYPERQRRGPVKAWGNAPGHRRKQEGGLKVRPTSE